MLFLAFLVMVAVVNAAVNPLGPYSVSDVTVSGLSAGGFMAVQLHVTFSSIINGSAVFAGGPYYCARGNLIYAEEQCMYTFMGTPTISQLLQVTEKYENQGLIDNTLNMKDDPVYLYSGADDTVVDPKVMQSLETYYQTYVDIKKLVADYAVPSQHCWPTVAYGNSCAQLKSPYIGKCNFDGAGNALTTLYGSAIKPAATAVKANFMKFSQNSYYSGTKTSIADTGYIYVPTACQSGTTCSLHVVLHGCEQTEADIGTEFAENIGMNEYAEANNIIMLYPFVKRSYSSPSNPNGCWDWWGYTDANYANNKGVQMKFIRSLITAVSQK